MKEIRTKLKRLLSGVLCLAMILTALPTMGLRAAAEDSDESTQEYVSLPITIRDYAADGMLFEFNQVGATGTTVVGGATPTREFTAAAGGTCTATVKDGYVRYTSSGTGNYITYTLSSETRASLRYCAIKYRTNAAYSSQPTIGHRATDGDHYVNFDTSGYNTSWKTVVIDLGEGTATVNYISLFPRLASGKYIDIAYIAFFAEKGDAETYNSNDGVVVPAATYQNGDTAGFSLLATSNADYINNLPFDESTTIAGTDLIQNGTWGLTTDPKAITATLNSGATQEVYGAWIRTNLVEGTLVNGEMVYTEAAVDYLASYMQQIMAVKWQNSDGSYNTYYVMGAELSDLGGTDLATKIRAQVTGGLGTYAEAKAKFEAGGLSEYTGIETWYDAAYFLLHNVFNDNTGYGTTVNNYTKLNLVQTTNSDGETCYVFNSGYDNAVYDYTNGVIYNKQTETITGAKTSSGADQYVRGNLLPAARFDPLGESGAGVDLGYGKSGDTYGDLITDSTADWADYYDTTNYNLSLEGHAKFIYYADSDLYFTFTGDDDVYLYINGVRVMDLGAAHSISKVKINLNDVAELCGLKDGLAYDFDFFYMERHGTAANFGIETNIRIVDPSMLTTKTGFQNGHQLAYNGYVDPSKPVTYQFSLQNSGDADIQDLTFTDGDIGVYLSKDSISLNSETTLAGLTVTVYNADGSVKESVTAPTEEKLKALLEAGLEIGEKITIYGFNYTIPAETWKKNENVFPNTVYTTAISIGENSSKHDLNGMADFKVRKMDFVFENIHLYAWGNLDSEGEDKTALIDCTGTEKVTLTNAEVLAQITKAGVELEDTEVVICSASGSTTINVNKKATVNSDGSITYTATNTGADTYYYMVGSYGPVRVDVYTYGVAPNTYVLDYSLPVELFSGDAPLTGNDVVSLGSNNPYETSFSLTGISDATSNYGTFTYEAGILGTGSLIYTMNKIMNNKDSVNVSVVVLETGATEVTKFTGVAMVQSVVTVPASVVYYEDNFAGITYVTSDGNQWVTYETSDSEGNFQSADQESNYGSDPNYSEDKHGELKLNEDGLSEADKEAAKEVVGDASNGTISVLDVYKTGEILNFTFQGTGFEIIARTTDEAYAVLSVKVTKTVVNEAGEETTEVVRQFPVICESENGDLYQVPVISVTDLDHGTYTVSLIAAYSANAVVRTVYIDGIRIYSPLTEAEALEYYNPDEAQAVVTEIKTMINAGTVVYAGMPSSDEYLLGTGDTVIEWYADEEGPVLTTAVDLDEYLTCGPNNELYLDGSFGTSVIAFYATPDADYTDEQRTIQIGAHRKTDSQNGDVVENKDTALLVYGSTAEEVDLGVNSIKVASGTEQYITIEVSKLTADESGRYLVLIGNNGENDNWAVLALTNLKVSGYTIEAIDFELEDLSEEDYSWSPMAAELMSLNTFSLDDTDEPETDEPETEESEPEEPETEESEPEEPETEESEPEEPETEESEPEEPETEESEPEEPETEESEPEEPETEESTEAERPVNENLEIISAELSIDRQGRRQMATLRVVVSGEVESFEIVDENGNTIEISEMYIEENRGNNGGWNGGFGDWWNGWWNNGRDNGKGKDKGNHKNTEITYVLTWEVEDFRWRNLSYVVRAVDENGAVSVNEQTVSTASKR